MMATGGRAKKEGHKGLAGRMACMACALALLNACGLMDGVFAGEEEAPLPGERISVLLHERALKPDPKVADAKILLPQPSVNASWPQSGGYANHAMHHIAVGEVLKPLWTADVGEGADDDTRIVGAPIVAGGRVFAMDAETTVSAFDAKTGKHLWEVELTPEDEDDGHISGGIAFEDGRVFVATGFAQVIALDAGDGSEIWRQNVGGPLRSAPTVRGGRVFVVTVDNKLHALDAINGGSLWTHTGITEVASLLGGGSPAVDGGVVVVPYSSGELVALKVENGRLLWADSLASARRSAAVSTLSHIRGRPVIDRGRVFALSTGGLMVAIDLRTGRRIWDREIGGLESPWVAGDYLFVLSNNSELVCLSRRDGRIHWVRALARYEDEEDKEDPIVWSGPILAGDRLILAGSHGEVLSVSPYTGRILGREEMADGIPVSPVAAHRSVYFLSDDAELLAYR